MNKSIEQMILEELINEARNNRTAQNMPRNYKEKARETFDDMVDDPETLESIWIMYGPGVGTYMNDPAHKQKLRALGGNDKEIDKEDLEVLMQTAEQEPNINSIDDLLNTAAQRAASNNTSTETGEVQVKFVKFERYPGGGGLDGNKEHSIVVEIKGLSDETKQELHNFYDGGPVVWNSNNNKLQYSITLNDSIKNTVLEKLKEKLGEEVYNKMMNTRVPSENLTIKEIIDQSQSDGYQPKVSNQTDQPQPDNQTNDQDDEQDAQEQALLQKSVDTYKKSLNNFLDEIEQVETAQKEDEMVAALYQQLLKLYNELKEPERDERTDQRVLRREGILREQVNMKSLKLRLAKILRQYKEIKKLLKDFIDVAKSGQFKRERLLKEFLKEVRLFAVYIKTAYKNLPDVQNESLITENQTPYEIFLGFIAGLRNQQDDPFANKQALLDRLKEIIVNMKKDILPLFYSVKPFISSGAYKDRNELLDYTEEFTNLYKRHIVNAVSDLRPFLNDDDPAEGFSEAIDAYKTALTDFRKEMLDLFGIQIGENNEAEVADDDSSEQQPISQGGSSETSTTQTSAPTSSTQTSDSDQAQTDDGEQAGDQGGQQDTPSPTQDSESEEGDITSEQETILKFLERNGKNNDSFKYDYSRFGAWLQTFISEQGSDQQLKENENQDKDDRVILIEQLILKAKEQGEIFTIDKAENLAQFIVKLESDLKDNPDFKKHFPIDKAIDKLYKEEKELELTNNNVKRFNRLLEKINLFRYVKTPEDFEKTLKQVFSDSLWDRTMTSIKGRVMEEKNLNESIIGAGMAATGLVMGFGAILNNLKQGKKTDLKDLINQIGQNATETEEKQYFYYDDEENEHKFIVKNVPDEGWAPKREAYRKFLESFKELVPNINRAIKGEKEEFIGFLVETYKTFNETAKNSSSDYIEPVNGKDFIRILKPFYHQGANNILGFVDSKIQELNKIEAFEKKIENFEMLSEGDFLRLKGEDEIFKLVKETTPSEPLENPNDADINDFIMSINIYKPVDEGSQTVGMKQYYLDEENKVVQIKKYIENNLEHLGKNEESLEDENIVIVRKPEPNDFDDDDLDFSELDSEFPQDDDIDADSSSNTNEQIERKLETIIEQFINKRKQQWQKRTM